GKINDSREISTCANTQKDSAFHARQTRIQGKTTGSPVQQWWTARPVRDILNFNLVVLISNDY
ncbi:MAG: hypothetical protein L0Y50_04670, partial [Beijerinckiaceae bacterium]|nr:hypothetical protein [Beijerinckiaceae bacterium]